MELIQELRESKNETNVALTDFFLVYRPGLRSVYCFVEAQEDLVYYGSVFRVLSVKKEIRFFQCKGKDGVLSAHKLLQSKRKYRDASKGFFIDRDFDRKIWNRDIYETPYYSIESFYTSMGFLNNILVSIFNIPLYSDDHNACLSSFLKLQKKFHEGIINLNSMLACYSKIRAGSSQRLPRLKIDAIFKLPDDLVSVDLGKINLQSNTHSDLDSLFSLKGLISKSKFKKRRKKMQKLNKAQRFRGKFEIFFMIKFLHRLKHLIEDSRKTFCSTTYKTPVQFNKETFMVLTNSFADVPNCLRRYIIRLIA